MIPAWLEQLGYLVAAVLFILGLKRLGSPATARDGNRISGAGMLLAIGITLLDREILSFGTIAAGMIVGTGVGLWMARAVKMTAMPQMVALLNGFGGAASLLVSGAEFLRAELMNEVVPIDTAITTQLGILIGAVTFTGSLVAWGKLQEVLPGRPLVFPAQKAVNALLFLAVIALAVYQIATPEPLLWPFYGIVGIALVLGLLLVVPIGGADMPVVISLLNSYSGIAAAMTGFVIDNSVLIISGALVGSSGIILSQIMCKAMNRSLTNVLFGAFGGGGGAASGRSAEGLTVKSVSVEDAAIQLAYARSVIVVPGYGLAVAQAQHQVRELADLIERRGGEVKYAIHPVAGRMPGHMNVLLAEANVPYDKLYDMEQINPEFERADVALVIGANDVVNPAARSDPGSPIYGMPILDVDKAKSVIVMKRGMSKGFAGVENDLFYDPKTSMLFGDAKGSLTKLVTEVKAL
ncbi:MAG TPA: NAD(P)(+) transhydrogenase (Re/Si-specific) subunit beta [Gemmatimonadaceae bacterium]